MQDTGLIQGITEAAQSVSYSDMVTRQQALAEIILKDPDVDEPLLLSSASTAPTRRSTAAAS